MFGLSPAYSGMVFALVTACGLGAITTQAKLFYAEGGNALSLMFMRFLASTLIFALLLLVRRQSFAVASRQRLPLALLGLIWSGAMIFYLLAVETISVSLAVLLLYFYPLLVLAYAIARAQLKASLSLIALFLAAFIGLYLALSGGAIEISAQGIVFATLASIGAAFTFVCGARVAPTMSPLLMTFWINAAGLLMILPLMANQWRFPTALTAQIALGLATGFYLLAILSQFQALARLPAARAAFLLNLEPVISILMARLILDEVLSIVQYSGILIVLSVIVLSLRIKPGS